MPNKIKINLLMLFMIGVLCACDPESKIRYYVLNKTSSTLNLSVNSTIGSEIGSSCELKPNDEFIIFESQTLGYASDIIKYKSINMDFLNCLTITKDSIPLKITIKDKSNWTSENIGDTLIIYKLIIKSDSTK